jgi:hypothetical protein
MPSLRPRHRLAFALCLWSGLASEARAQEVPGPASPVEVSGSVNVNSKGISLVPALTLGRPAAIFDLAVRKGHFGFEPQFRFALDGKPWSFLLWGRYRAVTTERFRLTVGGHPAFSFRTSTSIVSGTSREQIDVRRYLAIEATPTFVLSRDFGVGGYYLYSHGIDPGAPPHTQFAAARTYLSNLRLAGNYVVSAAPQLYYLRTNGQDGTYVGASASIGRLGSPWALATIVNQPIQSNVVGGQSFLWNVSVNYAFRVR